MASDMVQRFSLALLAMLVKTQFPACSAMASVPRSDERGAARAGRGAWRCLLGRANVFDFSVSLCLGGDKPHCFCLITSYNTILAATPTLSDSTSGTCGMATTSFISLMRSRGNPEPSLPTKIASGPAILA